MTTPFFTLIDIENPYRIRCGERRLFKVEVEPFVAGKSTLTLSLTAPTCFFGGGKKEIIAEFEAADENEIRPLEVQLVMMGSRATTYTLKLKIEAENSEGGKYDELIEVKLNCTNPMSEEEQAIEFSEEPLTTLTTPIAPSETETEEEDTEEDIVSEEGLDEEMEETTDSEEMTEEDEDDEETP